MTIGDQVRLKSGGPEMCVIAVDGKKITCVWIDGNKINAGIFNEATLI
jgi:uncharacterized protein YodC (DUF2158 family)